MRQHALVKICLMAIPNINFQMFSVRGPCDPLYDRKLVEGFCHSLPHRPSVVSVTCFQVVFLHRSYVIWYQEYNDVWKHPHGSKRHPNISSHEGAHILYLDTFTYFFQKISWIISTSWCFICPSIFDKKSQYFIYPTLLQPIEFTNLDHRGVFWATLWGLVGHWFLKRIYV